MKSYVTMEQKICPVCGKTQDTGNILLDMRLREQFENHTTTGFGMCDEHQNLADAGYIALVVCDESRSEVHGNHIKLQDAYRTGQVIHIRATVAMKLFNRSYLPDVCFIDQKLADRLAEMKEMAEQ